MSVLTHGLIRDDRHVVEEVTRMDLLDNVRLEYSIGPSLEIR